ncbi:MAG: ABC transporter permease [Actinomycetota bacterium]
MAAVGVVVLVTVTIAALGPSITRSVIDATVRARLADAPADRSGIEVLVRAPASEAAVVAEQVTSAALPLVDDLVSGSAAIVVTDSFDATDTNGADLGGENALTFRLASIEATRPVFETTAGRPAVAGADPVEAVLHVDAAEATGIEVGDRLVLTRAPAEVGVQIVGLVEPADPADPLWYEAPLGREGVVPGRQFTEIGPVLVPSADLVGVDRGAAHRIRYAVDSDGLGEADIDALEAVADRLRSRLSEAEVDAETATGLEELVGELRPTLSSTRGAVAVVVVQLVAMSLPAISVATGALVSAREGGNSLLRARGIRPGQLTRAAAVEAGVIVGVAVVVAPLLALLATEAIERLGPVADAGLDLRGVLPPASWLSAALAGLVALALLVWPVHRQATSFTETRRRRARASGDDVIERWGIDLALAVVAVLGFLQLRSSGSPLSDDLEGRLEVDPVLVVAPALGLVAAGLLALRVVRLVGAAAAEVAARSRGLHGALAAWQTSRRPGRTRRIALLVVVAVAVATYAVVFGATWERARVDQAAARAGADVVATMPTRDGAGVPIGVASSIARSNPGVDDVVVTSRQSGTVGGDDRPVTVLSLDASAYGSVVRGTDRILDDPAPVEALAEARVELGGTPLPETVTELALRTDVDVTAGSVEDDLGLVALLVDADGTPWRTEPVAVPPTGSADVRLPLTTPTVDGDVAPPTPHRLVGWELAVPAPSLDPPADTPPEDRVPIRNPTELVLSLTASAPTSEPLFPIDWQLSLESTGGTLVPVGSGVQRLDGDGLVIDVAPGANRSGAPSQVVLLSPSAVGAGAPEPLPVVVGEPVAQRTGLLVGDPIAISSGTVSLDGIVSAVVPGLPSVPDGEVVVVDEPSIAAQRLRADRTVRAPTELAISVDDARHEELGQDLAGQPVEAAVVDRRLDADAAANDATTVGILAMFSFGAIAAAAVAIIGLAVGATADARERTAELAVLEALGVTVGGIRRLLVREALLVVAVSVGLGIGTGLVLGAASVESLTVGDDGLPVIPEPVLQVPVPAVAAIALLAAASVVVLPQLTVAARREQHAANVLRSGEIT